MTVWYDIYLFLKFLVLCDIISFCRLYFDYQIPSIKYDYLSLIFDHGVYAIFGEKENVTFD